MRKRTVQLVLRGVAGTSIRHLIIGALSLAFLAMFCTVTFRQLCPDFISFWTAAKNLTEGEDPYDIGRQSAIQRDLGWDKQENGLGIYDFMPFYYPPWFAMICTPFIPLGYGAAKIAWLALNLGLLLTSAYLLMDSFAGVARSVVLASAPFFAMSLYCLQLGQTSILILFLIAASWKLLEGGRDLAAGALFAWATVKPHLSAVVLISLFLWSLRQKRWGFPTGFFLTLALLCLGSSLLLPEWFSRMLKASLETPAPTQYFPWSGATWFLLLKGAGISGWALYLLCGVVAASAGVATIRSAIGRETPLREIIGLSLLVTFLIVPYGRAYDFPILLVPFLVLLGSRLPEAIRALLLLLVLILPYAQWGWLLFLEHLQGAPLQNMEITYFWIPCVLLLTWAVNAATSPQLGRLLSSNVDRQPTP